VSYAKTTEPAMTLPVWELTHVILKNCTRWGHHGGRGRTNQLAAARDNRRAMRLFCQINLDTYYYYYY